MPINLPNGGNVDEIILPNGASASEVYGPNGNLVWQDVVIPDSVVEDFERDNPISNYVGDTADFSISATAIEGGSSLSYDSSNGGEIIHTTNTVEGDPPQRGDTVGFLRYTNDNTGVLLLDNEEWQTNSEISGYYVRGGSELTFWRVDNESMTQLDSATVDGGDSSETNWVDIEIRGSGDDMTAEYYKIDSVSGNDYVQDDRESSPSASVTVTDGTYQWGRYGWRNPSTVAADPANDYLRVIERKTE